MRAIGADPQGGGLGSPCSVPSPLLDALASGEAVLVLGWGCLASILGSKDEKEPDEPTEILKLASLAEAELKPYAQLTAKLFRRIVYLASDGILARLLGERVLDIYGSRLRFKCSKCGMKWWARNPNDRRCPRCGEPGVEDYTPQGGRPPQRVLAEAIYEVTTASAVVAACVPDEPIPVSLLALAAKYSKVYSCDSTPQTLSRHVNVLGCSIWSLVLEAARNLGVRNSGG